MELAKEAKKQGEENSRAIAASAIEFREVRKALEDRVENEQDWRESLGRRLDKQDEEADERASKLNTLIYGGLVFLVLTLLGVVGFFLERLPIFK